MTTLDLSGYPPFPVLMLSATLDTICSPLKCQEWRAYVPFWKDWFSHIVPPFSMLRPPLLAYQDFLDGRESSLGELWTYAMKTPSTSLGDLTSPAAMMTLLALVLILRTLKAFLLPLFSDLGRKAGRKTHGPDWENYNEIRIVKFGEYVFRLLFHFSISLYGIYYFWDKEWWDSSRGGTTTLFVGYPHHAIAPGMAWYYLVQSAYNVEALVSLAELSLECQWKKGFPTITWSNTVRGDFREMAVHHVVTNLLVIGSSYARFTRIGSMVFLVHDVSDVPVDLSKLANFLKWKVATQVCFTLMVLAWLVMRLTVFPFVIYRSVLTESALWLEPGPTPLLYFCYRPFFYYLIGQIILLHIAWFSMFIRMGYLLMFKGEAHDLSEHKNGEKQLNGVNRLDKMNGKKRI